MPREHRDSDGAARRGTPQPHHHLPLALLPVAAVATLCQRTGTPFARRRGEDAQDERALSAMPSREGRCAPGVAAPQPIPGAGQGLRGCRCDLQDRAQARRRGVRAQAAGRGPLRLRGTDTRDAHGQNPRAMPPLRGRDEPIEAQAAHGPSASGDLAMREAADNLKGGVRRPQEIAPADTPQGLELGRRPRRALGQGPGVDLPALAGAFAPQDCRWRGAIGNGCDRHAVLLKEEELWSKDKPSPYMPTSEDREWLYSLM